MSPKHPVPSIVIPAIAICWLLLQAWASPRVLGIGAVLVIFSFMIPNSPRRRPLLAYSGFLLLFVFLLSWIVILTGDLRGPGAFGIMIGGILLMGLVVPLIYALSFPHGGQR